MDNTAISTRLTRRVSDPPARLTRRRAREQGDVIEIDLSVCEPVRKRARGTPEPAAEAAGTPEPAADEASTPEPAADEASTPEPAADEASTPEPAADEASTPEPAADEAPEPAADEAPEPAADEVPEPAADEAPLEEGEIAPGDIAGFTVVIPNDEIVSLCNAGILELLIQRRVMSLAELCIRRGARVREDALLRMNMRAPDAADVARVLMSAGASPNASRPGGPPGRYVLIGAAISGNLDLVKALVDYGASVFSRSGGEALAAAAEHGHADVVEYLLARGVDPNRCGAIISAAEHGRIEIAKMLLANKSCVPDLAVATAATRVDTAMTKLLLDHGGNLKAVLSPKDFFPKYINKK